MSAAVSNEDDKYLFARISLDNEAAFEEIYFKYLPQIKPFIFGIIKNDATAADLVQEVFMRLWLARHNLAEVEQPSSYIYRIASNVALTAYRRQKTNDRVLAALLPENVPATPEAGMAIKQLQQLIQQGILLLPEQRRRIFVLSREKGLSRREIAEEMGLSENTVRNQLGFSMEFLKKYIKENAGLYILLVPSALYGL